MHPIWGYDRVGAFMMDQIVHTMDNKVLLRRFFLRFHRQWWRYYFREKKEAKGFRSSFTMTDTHTHTYIPSTNPSPLLVVVAAVDLDLRVRALVVMDLDLLVLVVMDLDFLVRALVAVAAMAWFRIRGLGNAVWRRGWRTAVLVALGCRGGVGDGRDGPLSLHDDTGLVALYGVALPVVLGLGSRGGVFHVCPRLDARVKRIRVGLREALLGDDRVDIVHVGDEDGRAEELGVCVADALGGNGRGSGGDRRVDGLDGRAVRAEVGLGDRGAAEGGGRRGKDDGHDGDQDALHVVRAVGGNGGEPAHDAPEGLLGVVGDGERAGERHQHLGGALDDFPAVPVEMREHLEGVPGRVVRYAVGERDIRKVAGVPGHGPRLQRGGGNPGERVEDHAALWRGRERADGAVDGDARQERVPVPGPLVRGGVCGAALHDGIDDGVLLHHIDDDAGRGHAHVLGGDVDKAHEERSVRYAGRQLRPAVRPSRAPLRRWRGSASTRPPCARVRWHPLRVSTGPPGSANAPAR